MSNRETTAASSPDPSSSSAPSTQSGDSDAAVLTDQRILVLDFGSQYAQLIARRVREQHVYCQIVRHDITAERIAELAPRGVILSGGPNSVYEEGAPQIDPAIFDLDIPVLGICYGMQVACQALGGKVANTPSREFGRAMCDFLDHDSIFRGMKDSEQVWMSHGDQVSEIADDFTVMARTSTCPYAAIRHNTRPVYAMQFHPEVTHTPHGGQILHNFVREVCGCDGTWRLGDFADAAVQRIRKQVGDKRVICGLSGGVDSSVVAALLYKAIGPQLSCILVDNGMLRKNEQKIVIEEFSNHFKTDLHVVDAEDQFLGDLAGVTEPQEKRRRIGYAFIECFKAEATKIEDAHFLAQGTLYPDVIESGADKDGPAATIKLHHNVGGLPEELGFELIEPLRDLFKDEVRRLGLELGLPEQLVWRHPFPGPGLAVRCLGEVTREKLVVLREADAIVVEEIENAGLYRETSQAFAVLLPVQSVGVMGDARTYDNAVAVRCVNTDDFMTADWSHLPYDLLARISTRIINEVKGVNRVCYDISSKPPATIEWE
ncbi:glutamine-hydrolyzing GMP synthase [Rhodopirellula sallentina]|uniref:GMP synthase [glutamine-hydrolyzing] n=1 Tax=Rhodopirellula sallentina SM41 TaxID=1263870 RepID=M5U8Q2_9BACT|nr:glutamine-hydrolyzing GMP synthase [Rhodopirellula sallentina]EMI57852.1 bifunctional GMP synthase/glutamine amidotransferase protein [Rhodopirellula sallentina SM41]